MTQSIRLLLNRVDAEVANRLVALLEGRYQLECHSLDQEHELEQVLQNQLWDVILLGDGPDLLDRFQIFRHLNIPFVVLSACDDVAAAVRAVKAGAFDYLVTTRLEGLPESIDKALKEQRHWPSAGERRRDGYENRLRLTFDHAGLGLVEISRTGRILSVNDRFCRILGFSAAELEGHNWADLIHKNHLHHWEKVCRQLVEGSLKDHLVFEKYFLCKDGSAVWVRTTFSAQGDQNSGETLLVVCEDISDRKLAAATLEAAHERWQCLWENVPDYMAELDQDGRILEANRVPAVLDPKRVIGGRLFNYIPEPQHNLVQAAMDRAIKTGHASDFELRIPGADGLTWWSCRLVPLRCFGENIRFLQIAIDITELRRTEDEFRQSESRYRQLAEASPVGIFRVDNEGRILYVNRRWSQITGQFFQTVQDQPWTRSMAVDDSSALEEAWDRARLRTTGLRCECRFQRPDGDAAWAVAQIVAELDSNQQVIGYIGTLTDISDQKKADRALRQSLDRYRQLFYTMQDAYVHHEAIYDPRGRLCDFRYLEVNPVFEKYMGVKREDIIGKTEREVFPDAEPFWMEMFTKVMSGDDPLYFERHLKMTGRIYGFKVFRCDDHTFSCALSDITERKHAEVALERSEKRYRTLFEESPFALWEDDYSEVWSYFEDLRRRGVTDLSRYLDEWPFALEHCLSLVRTVDVNKAAVALYQAPDKRQLLQRPQMLFGSEFLPVFRSLLIGLFQGQMFLQSEGTCATLTGEHLDLIFQWSVSPVPGRPLARVLHAVQDITRRKLMEHALEGERNFANAIFDTAGALIMVLDHEGHIVKFNKSCEEASGYSFEQVSGKPLWETRLLPRNRRRDARDLYLAREGGGQFTFVDTWRSRKAELLLISWSCSPLEDQNGRVTHLVAVGHDITEQRRAEREAELRRQQLVHADKLASLGTLVAGVAHEINNPNNYILLNSSILDEIWMGTAPILEAHRRQHGDFRIGSLDYNTAVSRVPILLEAIIDGGHRIKDIVSSLKDFARQDVSGGQEPVDINAAVRRAVTLTSLNKATRGLTLECDRDTPFVLGGRQRLEQVFINLLINACEALENKNGRIWVKTEFDSEEHCVIITVKDEGMGISRDLIKRITDPFFTTKRDSGGTGLGLSISDSIIREHGGTLVFESEPGEGTVVTVRLPAMQQEETEPVS